MDRDWQSLDLQLQRIIRISIMLEDSVRLDSQSVSALLSALTSMRTMISRNLSQECFNRNEEEDQEVSI